jgi:hypothetical protein
MKKNNYLIDKKWGQYHLEIVLLSYKAFNSYLGYHWDLSISVSTKPFNVYLGFIIGWVRFTNYGNK